MKKLGLLFKETSENLIKNNLKESEAVYVINYSKIKSPDLSRLRQSLVNNNARLFMVKNNVVQRALKGADCSSLIKIIEGASGIVFVKGDPLSVSRILYDFSLDHEGLKLEGGFLKDRVLAKKDIQILARLPSREVLRTQVVIALNSPILGLAIVLNQILRKFVYCLDQIKNKRGG